MHASVPFTRALAVLIAAVALIAAAPASGSTASSAAASDCTLTAKEAAGLGATKVSSLKVTKVTCADAKKTVKAFNSCRKANGVRGRCVKTVRGYACTEVRTNGPTEFSAKVTCRKSKAIVAFAYTQTG